MRFVIIIVALTLICSRVYDARMWRHPPRVCPMCNGPVSRAIYAGFGMSICDDDTCALVFGPWSFVMRFLPFTGVLFIYEGWYVGALWVWITGGAEDA